MPKHTEEFVHRIGRTGRAGSTGDAISFVGPKDWISFKNVEGFLQQTFKFDVVDSLKATFKGIKPKKPKVAAKSKSSTKINEKPQRAQPKKVIKRVFVAQDVGELPVLRKKTITPVSEIDSDSEID
jgi:superfamily II DNA/RNA helicase